MLTILSPYYSIQIVKRYNVSETITTKCLKSFSAALTLLLGLCGLQPKTITTIPSDVFIACLSSSKIVYKSFTKNILAI